jgi:hypothetical protein
VGLDFFGATTNFRLSFIFIEAQSLFSIGAKGVGKGLLKVEFFDCVLMRSGNLAANSLFEYLVPSTTKTFSRNRLSCCALFFGSVLTGVFIALPTRGIAVSLRQNGRTIQGQAFTS